MAVIFERASEFLEEWKSPILVRGDDIGFLQRQGISDVRAGPANAAIIGGRIIIRDFVHEHDIILQSEVSMCKARRNVKLSPPFSRKFCQNILPKCGGVASDIHGD